MSEHLLIRPKVPETCGTCRFSQPTPDLRVMMCAGAPPTPVVIGARQGPMGKIEYQVENFWPQVQRAMPGCSLWKVSEKGTAVASAVGEAANG
jgi:hypothetical protein